MTATTIDSKIIARTVEKESYEWDGVFWWKEFRLRRITAEEFYKLGLLGPYGEWLLEERYLARISNGRVVAKRSLGALSVPEDPEQAWQPWQVGKSKAVVIWGTLGDTSFFEANSLSALHRKLVEECLRLRAAEKAFSDAEKYKQRAYEAIDDFKIEENRKFSKRHGDKTGEQFEKARAMTLRRVGPELERLRAKARTAEQEYQRAKERVESLRLLAAKNYE